MVKTSERETVQSWLSLPPASEPVPQKRREGCLVIGDSSQRGTEAPIYSPDNLSREDCCLPEARICDITKRLPSLVGPEDYHPFLLVHIGSNEALTKRLQNIKDFMSLGQMLKGSEVSYWEDRVFSILPDGDWDPIRSR